MAPNSKYFIILLTGFCVLAAFSLFAIRTHKKDLLALPFVPSKSAPSRVGIARFRRSPGDEGSNQIKYGLSNPSNSPINPKSFLDKHVATAPFPSNPALAESLLVGLYNNIQDKFYSRPKQTLSFPPDSDKLSAELVARGRDVLKNPTIEKLEVKVRRIVLIYL